MKMNAEKMYFLLYKSKVDILSVFFSKKKKKKIKKTLFPNFLRSSTRGVTLTLMSPLFVVFFLASCGFASLRLQSKHSPAGRHLTSSTVTCENQASVLVLERNASGLVAPFAHGHSKDAFHATLFGHEVVLKRPRNDFADERLASAVRAFANELDRVAELGGGHPGIPRYFGSCLKPRKHHGEELTLVTERLITWWQFHSTPHAWCELVYSAISMVSLARFLQGQWHARLRPNGSGFLHCSINRAQFAFGPHGEAKLIDYGGLHRFDSFPAYVNDCTHSKTSDCESACMKSWFQVGTFF